MASTHAKRAVSDSYLKLIRQFPLRHIAAEEQLDDATEVLRDLLRQDLDEGGVQYRDALTDLIELYEDTAHPIPDASQAAMLGMLMESNRITGTELAKKTGISHSTISAVLTATASSRPTTSANSQNSSTCQWPCSFRGRNAHEQSHHPLARSGIVGTRPCGEPEIPGPAGY